MNVANRSVSVVVAAIGGAFLLGLASCTKQQEASGPPQLNLGQVKQLEQAAQTGSAAEKYNLGKKFRDGDTIPQNLTNAVVWFRKAADGGYAKAQYHLGLACEQGEGVAKNLTEAAKWYTLAAEQNFAKAQEKLGFFYWKGDGVPKNLVDAYKWLSLAAAGGEGKAAKGIKKLELAMTQQQIAEAKKQTNAFTPKKGFKRQDKKK